MRRTFIRSIPALAAVSALTAFMTCGSPEQDEDAAFLAQNIKDQVACGINDPSVTPRDEVRACDPGNTKKTTICHVPPGNPANAHTLCIGNAAVKHHLKNHDDYLGPCKREVVCPPAPDAGAPGTGGAGGSSGEGGAGGTAGAAGAGGTAGAPATGGAGGSAPPVIIE